MAVYSELKTVMLSYIGPTLIIDTIRPTQSLMRPKTDYALNHFADINVYKILLYAVTTDVSHSTYRGQIKRL